MYTDLPLQQTLLAVLDWLCLIKVRVHVFFKARQLEIQTPLIAVKYLQSGDGESAIVCAANTNLWCVKIFSDFPRFLTIILFLGLGHLGSLNSN